MSRKRKRPSRRRRSDIEEFREAMGEEPILWWHGNESVVVRGPIEGVAR